MKIEITFDTQIVQSLYNTLIKSHNLIFKQLDIENIQSRFFGNGKICMLACDGENPVGFAAGTYDNEKHCAYISFIGVLPEYIGQGVGKNLLLTLESQLLSCGSIEKIETVFHNPTQLPWLNPHKNGDGHPCAPGVDVSSLAYVFLKNNKYRDYAMQNAYYLNLDNYHYPKELAESRGRLLAAGIEITYYDEQKHKGFYELFDNINNTGWRKTVFAGLDKPIIVAVDTKTQLVCGYTGPLSTDSDGRGNFCGIGTHTDYRGHGIGKLIFASMCKFHSENGAKYMSLYTGETNPARNIYEAAGFCVVRSFANMRKMI